MTPEAFSKPITRHEVLAAYAEARRRRGRLSVAAFQSAERLEARYWEQVRKRIALASE